MERLKTCNSSICKIPKYLSTILKLISSYPALLFVFKEKNASLSSLIEIAFLVEKVTAGHVIIKMFVSFQFWDTK